MYLKGTMRCFDIHTHYTVIIKIKVINTSTTSCTPPVLLMFLITIAQCTLFDLLDATSSEGNPNFCDMNDFWNLHIAAQKQIKKLHK